MIARFDKFKRFETPLLTVCNPGSYVTSDNLLTNSVCALPYAKDIELTKNISDLPNGIVLVWSVYSGGSRNYGFNYVFVPKYHVENWNGFAPSMLLSSEDGNYVAWKYLYISDNKISGYEKNGSGEYTASSGIKFTPNHFVLRAVIGI